MFTFNRLLYSSNDFSLLSLCKISTTVNTMTSSFTHTIPIPKIVSSKTHCQKYVLLKLFYYNTHKHTQNMCDFLNYLY